MARHTIKYRLTDVGRTAALRAGLPAEIIQTLELPQDQVVRALDAGAVPDADGSLQIEVPHTTSWSGTRAGTIGHGIVVGSDTVLDAAGAVDLWMRIREAVQAEEEDDRRKATAAAEASAQAWLQDHPTPESCVVRDLWRRGRTDHAPDIVDYPDGWDHLPDDSPLAARILEIRDAGLLLLPTAREQYRLEAEAEEQARTAAREAAEAEKARLLRAWVEWATQLGGDLARAAQAGYEIRKGVVDAVLGALLSDYDEDDIEILVDGSARHDEFEWEERDTPSSGALDVADRLAEKIKSAPLPAGMKISAPRVVRATHTVRDPDRYEPDDVRKYTAVHFCVSSPLVKDRDVLVSCE